MLASIPASMLNQNRPDLGIPNRIDLKTSRFSFDKKEPLTFHKTVFVPPVEDKPDKGKEGQTTLI